MLQTTVDKVGIYSLNAIIKDVLSSSYKKVHHEVKTLETVQHKLSITFSAQLKFTAALRIPSKL